MGIRNRLPRIHCPGFFLHSSLRLNLCVPLRLCGELICGELKVQYTARMHSITDKKNKRKRDFVVRGAVGRARGLWGWGSFLPGSFLFGSLLLGGCGGGGTAPVGLDTSKILFRSSRDHHLGLYQMNADGTNQTLISNALSQVNYAEWNPERTRVVFAARPQIPNSGYYHLYLVNTDGRSLLYITQGHPSTENLDNFAVSSQHIGFTGYDVASNEPKKSHLYLSDADGHNIRVLRSDTNINIHCFSPEGNSLLCTSSDEGGTVLLDLNGNVLRHVSSPGGEIKWSSRTNLLASHILNGTGQGVYVTDFATDVTRKISNLSVQWLNWHPNGRQLVLGNDAALWIINADGSNLHQIFTGRLRGGPLFSPDGRFIVFSSLPENASRAKVCRINADGSNFLQLSTEDFADYPADWQ